jgi:predicted lipid-binding transport protein (Tim44 family)
MPKNLKRFLSIAAGGLLGATLYGIGQHLITGYTDIEHLIRFTVIWLIGGSIGFLIAIKMLDL